MRRLRDHKPPTRPCIIDDFDVRKLKRSEASVGRLEPAVPCMILAGPVWTSRGLLSLHEVDDVQGLMFSEE